MGRLPRILVVDDAEGTRRLLGFLLSREPVEVSFAADGVEALASVQRERPDLVLTDVRMARMDGIELLRRLRADAATATIKVLFLSSLPPDGPIRKVLEEADGYILKPFSSRALLSTIWSLLQSASLDRPAAAPAREETGPARNGG